MSREADCNSNRPPDTSFSSTAVDEYQWFLDYGSQSQHHPSSVFSSLNTCEQLSYYNDLALAEVDMEDFRTEDIHSVLSALPTMCFPQFQAEREGEMFASITGSLIASSSPQSSSDGSGGSTMSICKSELLFSPVKECALPVGGNFSVDSLDCDDLLLTCQANKDNYTIAFDQSEYRENATSHSGNWATPRKALDTSMARSESIYTTWSKLRKQSSTLQLRRHASGNNNTASPLCLAGAPSALKSQSLPNLSRRGKLLKIYDTQSVLSDTNSSISCGSKKNNFNLIKLFMKQKSGSNEGMSVSSVSECWPPSNNSQSDSDSCARNIHNDNGNGWVPSAGFEDSLVTERKHGLIKEEDERSESVEQLSESVSKIEESILDLDLTSSQGKSKCTIKFNINNNNSIESPRMCRGQGTQTKRPSFAGSTPSSSGEDTEIDGTIPTAGATQIPVHLIDRSMQTSGFAPFHILESPNGSSLVKIIVPTSNEERKPVYVFYPNYSLPDLAFLQEKQKDLDVASIFLMPQKLDSKESPQEKPSVKRRPFSCNDVEALRKKGFNHVQDWDSLTFLLPREYRQILADVPEAVPHLKSNQDELKPLFCVSPQSVRPSSCDCLPTQISSVSTQPSSGYRGSSTTSSDSTRNHNPLFVYHYDSASSESSMGPPLPKRSISLPFTKNVPPRPPLPRGILRNISEPYGYKNKRYSMFELGSKLYADEMEDEGVDAGTCTDSSLEETPGYKKTSLELLQLEELLHLSQLKTSDQQSGSLDLATLRQQVSKFLIKQDPNSTKKKVSFVETCTGIAQKQGLVLAVCDAVEQIIAHFASAHDSPHCIQLGDTSQVPAVGQLILNTLCPALYAVLSDGLKSVLKTSFGDASNSVWQVVEATAQQGPLTASLNELVLTINTEHIITEGLIKFNAFLFGLLNVGSVDAWLAFLRTRDGVLRKHYSSDALLVLANTSGGDYRTLIDRLVESLKPLHLLPFNLDLLYECKQLKESLSRMEGRNTSPTNKSWNFMKVVHSLQANNANRSLMKETQHGEVKPRPRSCVETWTNMAGITSFPDMAHTIQKRWSNININSKLFQAFDRLASEENTEEEEYTDSLERNGKKPKSLMTDTPTKEDKAKTEGGKFRRLQRKWEMLSGKEHPKSCEISNLEENTSPTRNTVVRSRIPRPVTSPTSPQVRKTSIRHPRVSRVDQPTGTAAVRPSSLPYKGATIPKNPVQRRAFSSSRKSEVNVPRYVRTLGHHLASDNGHLSFKEGERLRVVLEVDSRWLLCCRGETKGLVPRSAIIRDNS